jgi:acyl-CoA reductase-like NAD-dependent aldehyde dehydrogenase
MQDLLSSVSYINEKGVRQYEILINGCWKCLYSNRVFEVKNPATGEIVGLVPDCDVEDVKSAIEAARHSSEISRISPVERLEIMERAKHLVEENRQLLAETISREQGKPISVALGEVQSTAERLHLTMEETRVLYGEYIPGEWVPDTKNKFAIVLRKPLGVVAAISPFNYPLFIAASKIIPAILAGNTVVAKPASATPITLILFVKILEMAGMPAGTINIVTGRGRSIGDTLVESPDIDAVSFTGSTSIGESIARKAGIKKLHLELGGKASAIVLDDANVDLAARLISRGTFRNSGQRCDAVSRVLITQGVRNRFIAAVLAETAKYKTGDPLDPATQMGTVISREAAERIQSLVDDAVSRGAKLLAGGKSNGLFYEATVLDGVTGEMRIAWEEIFGPVMPIIEVSGHEEAIRISNESEYGLDSCVFTQDIDKALQVAHELQDGSVTINNVPTHGVGHFPFGGNKKSGMGREGIKYSIDELTKLHTIIISGE